MPWCILSRIFFPGGNHRREESGGEPGSTPAGRFPLKTEFVTEIHDAEDLAGIPGGEIVASSDQVLLDLAKERGYRTFVLFSIEGHFIKVIGMGSLSVRE
ncbi:hypothetical protein SY88_13455 [Clostridiales bacterium PH28_bin88]|nr:hypothetical protein SY88_13455 [Clostridiales bacterium PH28_bin88]